MTTIDKVRSRLIDKIIASNNKQLLAAIDTIISASKEEEEVLLDTYQLEMLQMSEEDIKQGNVTSQEALDKLDALRME